MNGVEAMTYCTVELDRHTDLREHDNDDLQDNETASRGLPPKNGLSVI